MKLETQWLKGVAPTVVLHCLSRRPMYGYELVEEIARRSDDVLKLGQGTLYPLLYNLESKGWVEATWQNNDGKRDRKYYALTAAGEKQLADSKSQWELLSRAMGNILNPPEPVRVEVR